jgi:cytochrome P450
LEGAHERGHTPLDDSTLVGEATLAVAAGSDTTGTALTNAIFHLNAQPEILLRLRKEVDSATLDDSGDFDLVRLAGLSYLNAIIQETLRLHPALPNGSQRTPPPDGGPVIVAGQ